MYQITVYYIALLIFANYKPIYNSIVRSSIYYVQTPGSSICNI